MYLNFRPALRVCKVIIRTSSAVTSVVQLVETLFSTDDPLRDKSVYSVERTIFVAITAYNKGGKLNDASSDVQTSTRERTFRCTRACTTDTTPFARLLS